MVRSDVFAADGLYEKIVIRDIPLRGRTVRILLQDLGISGGLVLDDRSMAFDYTKYFDLYPLEKIQPHEVIREEIADRQRSQALIEHVHRRQRA